MRVLAFTIAALIAFAANSVLNRAALADVGMAPGIYTGVRLVSGAVMLAAIVALRGGGRAGLLRGSWLSAAALLIYAVAFSFAYVTLDAGIGALVLFGAVQVTMFGGALLAGQRPGPWRWAGAVLGLTGLGVLFVPGAATPALAGVALMVIAGAAWGLYSLRGQAAGAPLETTAGNFLRAAPAGLVLMLPWLEVGGAPPAAGVALAFASGALASGLGYALWYLVLPSLAPGIAAVAQLTVPLIALGGGMVFLGETPTAAFALAAALILGGVALAVYGPRLRAAA